MSPTWGVLECVEAVKSGRVSARVLAEEALDRIAKGNGRINAVTRVLAERALNEASLVDAAIAEGDDPGPLAGVPYGVKDLFDVAGLPTTAGARRLRNAEAAADDALVIQRLRASGAVLVATLNMDEFAYGFVTDNAHWGITRNPHDPGRLAGGSSGGSAAAVAAGMLPFALGSDTNGSVRIPASLCGVFGTKPTHCSLPMTGVYPFARSLDDVGVLARSAADLAAVDSVLRGGEEASDAQTRNGLSKPAFLCGWFERNLSDEMRRALDTLSQALANPFTVTVEEVAQARSAAFLITAYEGGRLHRSTLAADCLSYDPNTRDRLLAGAAIPPSVYREALACRARFAEQFDAIFASHDVLIAPSVYGPAPRIDDPVIEIDGQLQPARANLGLYTQPISLLGLAVVAVPLKVDGLPLGVQLIAAKGRDRALLAFAASLEERGLTQGIGPA